MKLLKTEKELSKHASLIVTNNRLVQEKKSWGKRTHKEIPLDKIDSLSFEYSKNIGLIVAGIVLIVLGFLFSSWTPYSSQIWFLMIIFGIIILIIGLLLKKEFVEFSSSTLKIRECVVLKFLTL
ncbi:MAG: hypothetical protein KBONHNOK_00647 [Candidatus Methanoperedenaceae archaeon GB50]|nr:MAG: hypothetical protein KBONHNOK_00647 [Candidatus Methanoperedenaceae archaeon GB50]